MRKKVMAGLCLVLAAAVLAAGIWFGKFHSRQREATEQEVAEYSEYRMKWVRDTQAVSASPKNILLSFCTREEEQGDVISYEPVGLEKLLYRCGEAPEVYIMEDVLYVEYDSTDGYHVTLHFRDDRSIHLYLFDRDRDILYTETEEEAVVTTNYYRSLRRRAP